MAPTDLVTLAEAKDQVNITDSSADSELPRFISSATGVVERYVGPVVHRTVTETFNGGGRTVLLGWRPVVSVTSVTEDGTALASDGYRVATESGVLTRMAGPSASRFAAGVASVVVTYVAGQAANTAAVPGHIRMAALIIIQHMWETQRPAAAGPFSQAADDYDPRYAYSIPRRALELLGEPVGGIA